MHASTAPTNRTAFTLIELLVVVAILLPSLQRARESARRAACLSNVKSIATGRSDVTGSAGRRDDDMPTSRTYETQPATVTARAVSFRMRRMYPIAFRLRGPA